jgi:hypothetical protein
MVSNMSEGDAVATDPEIVIHCLGGLKESPV